MWVNDVKVWQIKTEVSNETKLTTINLGNFCKLVDKRQNFGD